MRIQACGFENHDFPSICDACDTPNSRHTDVVAAMRAGAQGSDMDACVLEKGGETLSLADDSSAGPAKGRPTLRIETSQAHHDEVPAAHDDAAADDDDDDEWPMTPLTPFDIALLRAWRAEHAWRVWRARAGRSGPRPEGE